MPGICQVIACLREQSQRFVIEFTAGAKIGNRKVENVCVLAFLIEVVGSGNPVKPTVVSQQLELLTELFLLQIIEKL
jgi:hypothetical protein